MKFFLVKLLIVLLPVLLFVVSINYLGDPAKLFVIDYEKTIASGILEGHNVTNLYNYNEGLLQKILITNGSSCPEDIVIGSSRTMNISSSMLKSKSFFNNGISGASIVDLIAIVEMYE